MPNKSEGEEASKLNKYVNAGNISGALILGKTLGITIPSLTLDLTKIFIAGCISGTYLNLTNSKDKKEVHLQKNEAEKVTNFLHDLSKDFADNFMKSQEFYQQRMLKINHMLKERGVETYLDIKPHKNDEAFELLLRKIALEGSDTSLNLIIASDVVEALNSGLKGGVGKYLFNLGEIVGAVSNQAFNHIIGASEKTKNIEKDLLEITAQSINSFYTFLTQLAILPSGLINVCAAGVIEGLYSKVKSKEEVFLDPDEINSVIESFEEDFKDKIKKTDESLNVNLDKLKKLNELLKSKGTSELVKNRPSKSKKIIDMVLREISLKAEPARVQREDEVMAHKIAITGSIGSSLYTSARNFGKDLADLTFGNISISPSVVTRLNNMATLVAQLKELQANMSLAEKDLLKSLDWQIQDYKDDLHKISKNVTSKKKAAAKTKNPTAELLEEIKEYKKTEVRELKVDIDYAAAELNTLMITNTVKNKEHAQDLLNINKLNKVINEIESDYFDLDKNILKELKKDKKELSNIIEQGLKGNLQDNIKKDVAPVITSLERIINNLQNNTVQEKITNIKKHFEDKKLPPKTKHRKSPGKGNK
jgi:hypothetical protein